MFFQSSQTKSVKYDRYRIVPAILRDELNKLRKALEMLPVIWYNL